MSVRHLWDEIYQITTPTPFPVGDVHAYILKSEPITLIDSGVNFAPARAALQEALAELGLSGDDIAQIIITHSHVDHMGLVQHLHQQGKPRVLAHARACNKMADMERYAQKAMQWTHQVLTQAGVPAPRQQMTRDFYRAIPELAGSVHVDQCLDEGDSLRAGEHTWQVLFAPGHSGDLICLYDAERGLLIASDHLLPHISSNALLEPPLNGSSKRRLPLLEYWRSLERTDRLSLRRVLPGHGEIITDHRSLLAERRRRRDERLAAIYDLLQEQPLSAWDIAQTLFPRRVGVDVYLAVSEVVGHMDMLIAQGRARQLHNDRFLYQRLS